MGWDGHVSLAFQVLQGIWSCTNRTFLYILDSGLHIWDVKYYPNYLVTCVPGPVATKFVRSRFRFPLAWKIQPSLLGHSLSNDHSPSIECKSSPANKFHQERYCISYWNIDPSCRVVSFLPRNQRCLINISWWVTSGTLIQLKNLIQLTLVRGSPLTRSPWRKIWEEIEFYVETLTLLENRSPVCCFYLPHWQIQVCHYWFQSPNSSMVELHGNWSIQPIKSW